MLSTEIVTCFCFPILLTKFQTSSVNCEFCNFSDVILGPPAATQPNNQPSFFTMELHWARPGDGWKEFFACKIESTSYNQTSLQLNFFTIKLLYNKTSLQLKFFTIKLLYNKTSLQSNFFTIK